MMNKLKVIKKVIKQSCYCCTKSLYGKTKPRKNCKACNGTKVHIFKKPVRCLKCKNKGYSMFDYFFGIETIIGYREEYHKCYICDGKGEIPIFNPVFQKGSMIGNCIKTKVTLEDSNIKLKRFNKIMKGLK